MKLTLLEQLKQELAFRSYEPESVNLDSVDDDRLIALTRFFAWYYFRDIQKKPRFLKAISHHFPIPNQAIN